MAVDLWLEDLADVNMLIYQETVFETYKCTHFYIVDYWFGLMKFYMCAMIP